MKYWFDTFCIDDRLGTLLDGANHVPLKPKHVAVLALLIRRRPNPVSKEAILKEVWPKDTAEEGYVFTAISVIRKALRDIGGAVRYIHTARGLGYAFVYPDVRTSSDGTKGEVPSGFAKYGFRARRAISTWRILDERGTLERTQRIEGFNVNAGVTLNALEGHSGVWTPGSRIRTPPTLTAVSDFPKRLSLSLPHPLDSARLNWRLEVAGAFTEYDPPLDYTVMSIYDNAVLMSNEAVAQAYAEDKFKHDYFAWDATLPVESVTLSVFFPETIRVRCYPGVFWGQSEWWFHETELARVRQGFEDNPNGAVFTINQPEVPFRYFIYWTFVT